jgi:hypothetical protein
LSQNIPNGLELRADIESSPRNKVIHFLNRPNAPLSRKPLSRVETRRLARGLQQRKDHEE